MTDYDNITGVNWSLLKYLAISPLHYRWHLEHPREDTDALAFGRAVHCAVFEPAEVNARFAGFNGRRCGSVYASFCEAHAGREVLPLSNMIDSVLVAAAVRTSIAAPYLLSGKPEQVITWTDAQTGLACKGRIDWISDSQPAIVDLKTARSIDDHAFTRTAAAYRYHCQAAYYRQGLKAATGQDLPVVLIVVEKQPPFDVWVAPLDDDALYCGEKEVRRLLDLLAECQRTDKWPGRYPEPKPLLLPAYAFKEPVADPEWMED